MKKILNYSACGFYLSLIGLIALNSCSKDFPENTESDRYTDLKAIRIVNAGPSGDQVLEGKIDESTKVIWFPKIDTLTDFSNVKFVAETSDGAALEKDVFEIPFESGDTKKDVYLKIVNNPRFKEYRAEVRFKVPIYGANFNLPQIYDYSTNPLGNPTYDAFGSQLTRGTGFDGKYVLVASRGASGIHLLDVEKLKNNIIERIPLNSTGVLGGTFAYNMGAQVNGHSYVASLSGAAASPLKIYHWDSNNPTSPPDLVANVNVGLLSGAGARHGDNFSVSLDKNGNGYAFFLSANPSIIRVKITDYKVGSEPTVLTTQVNYEQWGHFNRVGDTDSYILSGHSKPMTVVSNSASSSFIAAATTFSPGSSDFRVINFNGERYLLAVTVNRGAPNGTAVILNLYNITRGSNIVDALTSFEQGDKMPVYSYTISGVTNTAPGTQSGFAIQKDANGKDEKLLIYGAGTDAGFSIIEFPVNVEED